MSMTNSILNFLNKYRNYLDKSITVENVNDINYYLERRWYMQILKQFGIVIVLILLKYFQKEEEYEVCQGLLDSIESSNKYFGTTYPLNLEDYGNMPKLLQ